MSYLKRKKGSLESSILSVWTEQVKRQKVMRLEWITKAKEKGEKTFDIDW